MTKRNRTEYNSQHYRENREQVRERHKKYNAENREAIREYQRQYREANREKVREYHRQWRAKNPDSAAENLKRHRDANRDAIKERARQRALADPERHRENVRRGAQVRRARKKATQVVPFTNEQWEQKKAYWGNRCYLRIPGICTGSAEHVEHVKPLSKGGPHMLANLRPACEPCNYHKRDKWPFG